MHLLLVGMNHRTAGLDQREALALADDERVRVLTGLVSRGCAEALVVGTCNRSEFYVVHHEIELADAAIREQVREVRGKDLLEPGPIRYAATDGSAARHLCRVAAGLDSMVLGDVQILGQLKEAVAFGRRAGTVGPLLDRLFDAALRTGKRARAETSVSGGVVSVASAAVELLREDLGGLTGKRLLVVGAGETARMVVRHLAQAHPAHIVIANRTLAAAQAVAESAGTVATAVGLDSIREPLGDVDGVISATHAPRFVVTSDDVALARGDAAAPLVMVDLAVPRDIDPAAARIPGVTVHAIDAIQRVVDATLSRRLAEVPRVERLVDDELERFEAWRRSRAVTPLVRELREHFEQVRAEELERGLKHATADERARVERLTQALINRLLHSPTISLKGIDAGSVNGQSRLESARDLFALGRGRAARRQPTRA